MRKHVGEIELDLLADLAVTGKWGTDDGEEDGGDVEGVDVAVVVPKEVLEGVGLLQDAEQRFEQRPLHQEAIHPLVHADIAQHVEHHLLEHELQLLLVEPPQLRRHAREDRHGLREDRHVRLLVVQQHHQRRQRGAREDARQRAAAAEQRAEGGDDLAERPKAEEDASLVLGGGGFEDGELRERREAGLR